MRIMLYIWIALLMGCASTQTQTAHTDLKLTDTMDVIEAAADATPKGVEGEFIFTIKASGMQQSDVYLNTELDYRDQRNITIAISPKVAYEFKQQLGQSPGNYFINKTIKVSGRAKRVKIQFFSENQFTEKYYYQTHIPITSTSQIEVL